MSKPKPHVAIDEIVQPKIEVKTLKPIGIGSLVDYTDDRNHIHVVLVIGVNGDGTYHVRRSVNARPDVDMLSERFAPAGVRSGDDAARGLLTRRTKPDGSGVW